jgi:hypothetical protein
MRTYFSFSTRRKARPAKPVAKSCVRYAVGVLIYFHPRDAAPGIVMSPPIRFAIAVGITLLANDLSLLVIKEARHGSLGAACGRGDRHSQEQKGARGPAFRRGTAWHGFHLSPGTSCR